jgi:NadR type nicotinamide-nucleotide adenylyltransferase
MPKPYKTGVVVGKFYPPHRGHKLLIDTAQAQCDRVTVIVCDKPEFFIPGRLRAEWLREIHPGAEVRVITQTLADDDSPGWAKATIGWLGYVPEAVFTSEDYGEPYARHMGCRHVLVDQARLRVPISGTAVRRDPLGSWDYLEPCVRAYFAKRICVLGAESTGTTTMAKALAERYRTVWVPEYGRTYAEGKYTAADHVWTTEEFTHIAEQQSRMEDWLARSAEKLVVADTDPFATTLWHERYMGGPSEAVRQIADGRKYDLYLLTADDIPFAPDAVRDGEHIRHQMHRRFIEALRETGRPFAILAGSHEERLKQAVALVDRVLQGAKTVVK